jgi:hypothetical protein
VFSATAYVIRSASIADVPELVRLGWADHHDWPCGRILVGDIRSVVGAALAIDENRTLAAELPGVAHLLAHLRARAAGIRAHRDMPCLADRLRPRGHRCLASDV